MIDSLFRTRRNRHLFQVAFRLPCLTAWLQCSAFSDGICIHTNLSLVFHGHQRHTPALTSDIDVNYGHFASKVPSCAASLTWFSIQETKENYMIESRLKIRVKWYKNQYNYRWFYCEIHHLKYRGIFEDFCLLKKVRNKRKAKVWKKTSLIRYFGKNIVNAFKN